MDFDRLRRAMSTSTPAPLHVRLRDGIEAQILDNIIPAGEKLPSERVIQEELALSRATVRNALRALTDAGYLQSMPGSGTFVLARQPALTRLGLVGVVVSRPNFHFFYPELVAEFSNRMKQAGYSVLLSMHNDRADLFAQIEREFLSQGVRAMAITLPRHGNMEQVDALLRELRQANIPVVLIGRHSQRFLNMDCVAVDNRQIGYEATRYLLAQGHQAIVHFGFRDYSTGEGRFEGYAQAMQEQGLQPRMIEMNEVLPASEGNFPQNEHLAAPAYQAAHQLWSQQNAPTAAFCFNDVVAMGIYKSLRDLSLRIPQDVSLISVDNLITVQHFEVPLTTFALPGDEIGRRSANLLLDRLAGSHLPPQLHLLPAPLIERDSVAAI